MEAPDIGTLWAAYQNAILVGVACLIFAVVIKVVAGSLVDAVIGILGKGKLIIGILALAGIVYLIFK